MHVVSRAQELPFELQSVERPAWTSTISTIIITIIKLKMTGCVHVVSHVQELPFELRALECCLESLAGTYDVLTTDLESAAYPLLDGLALGVSAAHFVLTHS